MVHIYVWKNFLISKVLKYITVLYFQGLFWGSHRLKESWFANGRDPYVMDKLMPKYQTAALDTTFCYRHYPHQHHFQINYPINIQGSVSWQAMSLNLQQTLFAPALYAQQWAMVGRTLDINQNTEQTFFLKSIFVLCLRSFCWTGDHARQSRAGEAEIVWVLSELWGAGSSFWQELPPSPFLQPWSPAAHEESSSWVPRLEYQG